jgi:hypothetical protein
MLKFIINHQALLKEKVSHVEKISGQPRSLQRKRAV